jgi:hypothetical protein
LLLYVLKSNFVEFNDEMFEGDERPFSSLWASKNPNERNPGSGASIRRMALKTNYFYS